MIRTVIVHGGYDEADYRSSGVSSASNRQWLPWLQNQLLIAGQNAQTPEVFRSFAFDYADWCRELDRHMTDTRMHLVGHSTGAGFLLRWLSEHVDVAIEKLVLVAPYLDPFDVHRENGFFHFTLDDALMDRVGACHLFHSADDLPEIVASVSTLLPRYPEIIEHRYEAMGHFTVATMGTSAFPDLLDALTAVESSDKGSTSES